MRSRYVSSVLLARGHFHIWLFVAPLMRLRSFWLMRYGLLLNLLSTSSSILTVAILVKIYNKKKDLKKSHVSLFACWPKVNCPNESNQ